MKTLAILEGWAGGPQHSKFFAQQAEISGFKIVKDPSTADFIVAHSAGCYFLPKELDAKLVLLINPPY